MILSLSGGGLNGLAYLGMFRYFESRGYTGNQFKIYGTSIGAIFGALWAMGFDSETLIRLFSRHVFAPSVNFCNFIENGGLDTGQHLQDIFKSVIKSKYDENITLDNFKNIYMCTCNLRKKQVIYLSHENFPDLPVHLAMRMSCNLPFIFEPVNYQNAMYIDGAAMENVPMPCVFDDKILFCKFSEENESSEDEFNYYHQLASLAGADKFHLLEKFMHKIYPQHYIVRLPKPFKVYDFWIHIQDKNKQIMNGFTCLKNFINISDFLGDAK
jgi:predicted acylesterase/phospholipase RssA